jgi:molybdopterin synthase catalytic subunit
VAADAPLAEGCEVALLPPVSGGSGGAGGAVDVERRRARLTSSVLDPRAVEAAVASPASGAVVLFLGTVRDHQGGRPVRGIEYHAYRQMAETTLERIARDLEAAEPGLRLAIHHRLGELAVGDTSVAIAASSPHRDAAYRACRAALERLKRQAPIWKRERYADGGAAWREDEPLGPA